MTKIPNAIADSSFNADIKYKDGSKSEAGIMKQNARNAKTYADLSNLFNHQYTLDERARQFETDTAVVAIQREQLREAHIAQMRNRDIQMNAQLEAYGASADQTAQQLKFNTEAGKQAYTAAEAQYLDRLKGVDFAVKGQRINNLEQFSNLASQYQDTVDSIGFQEGTYKTATENANDVFLESIRSARDRETLIGDIADRDEKEQRIAADNRYKVVEDNLANEETEELRNIGQVNVNSLAALRNQTKEAARSSLAQRTELLRSAGFDATELIRSSGAEADILTSQAKAQARELVTSTANQRKIIKEAAKEKKKEGFRAAAARRRLAQKGNELESDTRLAEVKNTIQNERSKLNVQVNQQQLQQLISTGSTSAKGGRGTSTQRALQSLGLLGSVNQAQLVSDFTRFRGQQAGVKERIRRATGIADRQADQAELAAQNQLRNMLSELDAEQAEAKRAAQVRSGQIRKSARDRAKELRTASRAKAGEIKTASRAKATEMRISTSEQNKNLRKELKAANQERLKNVTNVMAERERFGLAQAGESKRAAQQSAKDRQKTLKDEAKENTKSAEQQALLNQDSIFDQAEDRISFERNRTATQQAAINERANIMRMRTELTLEELGTTMLSATSAFQQAKGRIFMDKFEADAAAIANMMAMPEFADAPKTPFVIPDPEFILPPIPIEAPKNAVPIPPQQSGLSKALQIGGVVLGAAATALSMGTAAAIVGPLAAPIVGGLGGVASGAAKFTY